MNKDIVLYECLECKELVDLPADHVRKWRHFKGFREIRVPVVTESDQIRLENLLKNKAI
jgi:hypothetical protein